MNRFWPLRGFVPKTCLGLCLLVLTSVRLAASGQFNVPMETDAKASIRVTTINSFWDGLGWMPAVVRIENNDDRARTWEADFKAGAQYRNGAVLKTSAALTVQARSTREIVVMVPGPGRSPFGQTAALRVQFIGPGVLRTGSGSLTTSRDLEFSLIGGSAQVDAEVRRMATGIPAAHALHGALLEVETIDPNGWPADWRVWSSFPNLVLSQENYDGLDGNRRNALLDWVAQGGQLWLLPSNQAGLPDHKPFRLGFGTILRNSDNLMPRVRNNQRRITPWAEFRNLITEEDRVDWAMSKPIVALILFLVIFGVVVGPLNVFWFAPASRRHRLFITVPALSLAASVLLVVVIVVKDGFGGAGVRRALVLLVPGENKAVVFQQQISRTGVLLSKDFTLPADTSLSIAAEDPASKGVNAVRELERAGEDVSGAWFTSRASLSHELRRITPTRARVELVQDGSEGEPPVVQSSLTTTLRNFQYIDDNGIPWLADELPPGSRVTLKIPRKKPPTSIKGYFTAEGGASDLAPLATHPSIKWTHDTVIYTGRLEAARQP